MNFEFYSHPKIIPYRGGVIRCESENNIGPGETPITNCLPFISRHLLQFAIHQGLSVMRSLAFVQNRSARRKTVQRTEHEFCSSQSWWTKIPDTEHLLRWVQISKAPFSFIRLWVWRFQLFQNGKDRIDLEMWVEICPRFQKVIRAVGDVNGTARSRPLHFWEGVKCAGVNNWFWHECTTF